MLFYNTTTENQTKKKNALIFKKIEESPQVTVIHDDRIDNSNEGLLSQMNEKKKDTCTPFAIISKWMKSQIKTTNLIEQKTKEWIINKKYREKDESINLFLLNWSHFNCPIWQFYCHRVDLCESEPNAYICMCHIYKYIFKKKWIRKECKHIITFIFFFEKTGVKKCGFVKSECGATKPHFSLRKSKKKFSPFSH